MILLYILLLFIFSITLLSILGFFTIQIISSLKADAPFVSIPKGIETEIIKALALKNDSVLYDLGCGNGVILIEASKSNEATKCFGIEIGIFPFLVAKFKTAQRLSWAVFLFSLVIIVIIIVVDVPYKFPIRASTARTKTVIHVTFFSKYL